MAFDQEKKFFKNFLNFFKKSVDIWIYLWYYNQAVARRRQAKKLAGVAQPVEQLICNQQVGGSNPSTSSKLWECSRVAKGGRL